ncbi:MAG: class I SAM-dependent methyltransferase [Pseudomonadota bacterium]
MISPAFFTLHRSLPREGPGEAADVYWALSLAMPPAGAKVLDAACGPGADTLTLAEALPTAEIDGVEKTDHFVEEARSRTAAHGDRVRIHHALMQDQRGPFDLIWCAGAVYFLGVREALELWRAELAEDGAVAFSEPIWLTGDRPPELQRFWEVYAAMTDTEGVEAHIRSAGYRVVGKRVLSDRAWENYYTPMDARIAALREAPVSPALADVLADGEEEAMMWRQHRRDFGYCLFVVRPE